MNCARGVREGGQRCRDRRRRSRARRVAPAARAHTRHLSSLRRDVVDDVVGTGRITADAGRHVVQTQGVAGPPRDVVVGARRVAADADPADKLPCRVVQPEAAAKHVDAADAAANHRVIRLPRVRRVAAVGDEGVDRVALLKPEQAPSGLHGRVEIGRRQCQPGQAERVGGVGLLRRDHAAAWPLITAADASKRHRADDAVAVDDRAPHLQPEPTIGLCLCRIQGGFEGGVRRQAVARVAVAVAIPIAVGAGSRGGEPENGRCGHSGRNQKLLHGETPWVYVVARDADPSIYSWENADHDSTARHW